VETLWASLNNIAVKDGLTTYCDIIENKKWRPKPTKKKGRIPKSQRVGTKFKK